MRSPALFWFVVAALFLLHFFLHVGLGLGPEAPDLLSVSLLLAARQVHVGRATALGLGFGLLEDSLSVLSFGANAVSLTVVGGLGALTRDLFVGDSLFFIISYFFLGKMVRDLTHWVLVGESLRQPFVDQVLIQGSLSAIYAAAVGALVMAITGLWREGPK